MDGFFVLAVIYQITRLFSLTCRLKLIRQLASYYIMFIMSNANLEWAPNEVNV
jgi:hypothetical protein